MNNTTKPEYPAIDIAKLVCALLVVAIHTEPFAFNYWLDKAFGVLTRIPVPFFFMASGFFLFYTDKEKTTFLKISKYCFRILILYTAWSIIYLPLLYSRCLTDNSFNTSMFLKSIFWFGSYSHLWYLIASIVAALLTYVSLKVTSMKMTFFISVVFLIFGTMFSTYAPLFKRLHLGVLDRILSVLDTIGTRNGLFYGFFYITLGAYAIQCKSYKIAIYLAVFVVSFIALAVEGFIAVRYVGSIEHNLWFCAPPLVFSSYMIILSLKPIISKKIALICRNGSTIIYTSHRLFIVFLISIVHLEKGLFLCLLTTVIAIAFSGLILYLKEGKMRFLKYLY